MCARVLPFPASKLLHLSRSRLVTGHSNQSTIKPAMITKGSPRGPGLLLGGRPLFRLKLNCWGHLLIRLCRGWHFLAPDLVTNHILTSLGGGDGHDE